MPTRSSVLKMKQKREKWGNSCKNTMDAWNKIIELGSVEDFLEKCTRTVHWRKQSFYRTLYKKTEYKV